MERGLELKFLDNRGIEVERHGDVTIGDAMRAMCLVTEFLSNNSELSEIEIAERIVKYFEDGEQKNV